MTTLDTHGLATLKQALTRLDTGFSHLPDWQPAFNPDDLQKVLNTVAERMQDNYPYQHPLYAGQMLKPPHPVARLAYALAMWINPNNHALDGGRASSGMEKEAVAQIAAMFGWETHLGHLCSGGTMANLEALWVSGRHRPGETIAASSQAHYTHSRISQVLQLDFTSVPVDHRARMDVQALKELLQKKKVGTVVATLGTTGFGSVDPLDRILELRTTYDFRVHVDAAYGGYFTLADSLDPEARAAFDRLPDVDSIVVDPHKHGLQPYGCGCVLFRDPGVGALYRHDSPYTYFSSPELHLGEISLECSRAGASAVALWATLQHLPLHRKGPFAAGLDGCRNAARKLFSLLEQDPGFLTLFPPELDILVWAPEAGTSKQISSLSRALFERAEESQLYLALVDIPTELIRPWWPAVAFDSSTVTCLRSCLMKPEHEAWVERIWEILHEQRGTL